MTSSLLLSSALSFVSTTSADAIGDACLYGTPTSGFAQLYSLRSGRRGGDHSFGGAMPHQKAEAAMVAALRDARGPLFFIDPSGKPLGTWRLKLA